MRPAGLHDDNAGQKEHMHPRQNRSKRALLIALGLAFACAHAPATPVVSAGSEEKRFAVAEGWLLGTDVGFGAGVPVVFVHGAGGNHQFFEPQVLTLRSGRRVLAFDQRGCGGSANSVRGLYDLDTRVRDLGIVLDVARFDPVILAGHSTGALVIARYAERNPARVVGLVIVNPVSGNAEAGRAATLPDPDFRPAVGRWVTTALEHATQETAAKVLASVQEARTPAMRAMLADAASTELPASIARYPGPVLVLAAPGEPTLGELRPGVEVRRLSIESHWSTLDSAAEVNEALRDFVRPLRAERLGAVRPGTADSSAPERFSGEAADEPTETAWLDDARLFH